MPAADSQFRLRDHSVALTALAAALGLRWLLDPVIGDTLPLVTLFGAVACAVWVGGVVPAVFVALLGYVAGSWAFMEPRAEFSPWTRVNLFGFGVYAFTCGVIITMGQALRHARSQVLRDQELRRRAGEEQARQLLSARFLASIV